METLMSEGYALGLLGLLGSLSSYAHWLCGSGQ